MIVFDNVTLRYPYDEYDLLKGVTFTLSSGVNTVLADIQSGKSTICKLLLKDIAPTSGQIFVDRQQIDCITNSNLDILYLPRNSVFFERRSVRYNMEYPLRVRKVDRAAKKARVDEVSRQFGISLDDKMRTLNEAQRRTLALARGLTVKRKIALFDGFFDEETLDFQYVSSVLQHFDTCVILTSDPRLAMGHTVVLDGGVTVFEGDAQSAQEYVGTLHWLASKEV